MPENAPNRVEPRQPAAEPTIRAARCAMETGNRGKVRTLASIIGPRRLERWRPRTFPRPSSHPYSVPQQTKAPLASFGACPVWKWTNRSV